MRGGQCCLGVGVVGIVERAECNVNADMNTKTQAQKSKAHDSSEAPTLSHYYSNEHTHTITPPH